MDELKKKIGGKCMDAGVVPEEWKVASIVPLYKLLVDRRECENYIIGGYVY